MMHSFSLHRFEEPLVALAYRERQQCSISSIYRVEGINLLEIFFLQGTILQSKILLHTLTGSKQPAVTSLPPFVRFL